MCLSNLNASMIQTGKPRNENHERHHASEATDNPVGGGDGGEDGEPRGEPGENGFGVGGSPGGLFLVYLDSLRLCCSGWQVLTR